MYASSIKRNSCGSTEFRLCVLNRVYHNNFKRIIVVHNDISTQEYKLLDCDIVDEIPHIDEFDKTEKTLLILGDLNYRHMSKEQKHRWNRMYGMDQFGLHFKLLFQVHMKYVKCAVLLSYGEFQIIIV